mgnify:FL=1|tara:strand:- start:632 stop:994 length:363 start_codon:yes stop_codon:yes gene_type:complete
MINPIALTLVGLMTAITANAVPNEVVTEVTKGVFLTLTATPCTMYEAPPNVFLFQAYAVDVNIKQRAEGCFSVEQDGTVIVNLVNTKNNNQYGYVLPIKIFKEVVWVSLTPDNLTQVGKE